LQQIAGQGHSYRFVGSFTGFGGMLAGRNTSQTVEWEKRCHQRCAVAGETLKTAAAALSVNPSAIARAPARDRQASPSLALACRYIRALLRA
jgi:hypothetical protein